ncbi:MAG: 50S ribosomal protein L17 [Solitalea sp.]
MRHGKKINHLSRTDTHRKAMLANMASSLIKHKRINTTVAKAKALRVYVEPLLTKAKSDTTHSRRIVFHYLQDKESVTELFREVAVKIADRPGGYTRIIKTGNRLGDNAEMCFIELVDYNELYTPGKDKEKEKTTRRGRRRGKKAGAAADSAEVKAEQPAAAAAPEGSSEGTAVAVEAAGGDAGAPAIEEPAVEAAETAEAKEESAAGEQATAEDAAPSEDAGSDSDESGDGSKEEKKD